MKSTNNAASKIGFLGLVSMVIGAQLGASAFLMPAQMAQFRTVGLGGWCLGCLGAILITLVFSLLCIKTTKVGGPHIYARMFFGEKIGFFVTWVYWCGAWACNPIVISIAVNYLMSITGVLSSMEKLALEIIIVVLLTLLNTRGIKVTSNVEVVLTIIKIIPLIVVPIIALTRINLENFAELTPANATVADTLIKATILSFWGFVGLEEGTSPASVVNNPRKTIPLAIVFGTACVAMICILNTVAAFGVIHPAQLENEAAPFAKILLILFGGTYNNLIGIITFLICIGSLNAWVFFSGQIAQSAAKENIFPEVFAKSNDRGAPGYALWASAVGTIVILVLQKSSLFADKINAFLDMSIVVYITLYMTTILAHMKFMRQTKEKSVLQVSISTLALIFCCFVLYNSDWFNFSALGIMIVSGIPIYFFRRRKVAN
ncbi:MAG: amino acid permease [Puniceicoccales bacterium]|jgi:APA family basic amino acid/polyamine antiporter|nr:amino acid permease [Puniceicoccales bacterium]